MPSLPDRFDRKLHNDARVALPLASDAGSTAWSPAGRASVALPEYGFGRRAPLVAGVLEFLLVNRN